MKTKLLLAVLFTVTVGCVKPAVVDRQIYHADPAFEKEYGYARAVRAGDVLYVSGSVGWGEMADAVRIAYDRIGETLKAHGLDFGHVVMETVYTTDIESLIAVKDIRKGYYTQGYPAATSVQIDRLFNPDLVIEVEVTARFPGG